MAGAGYKLFQTGDVLTAAQVNTYLNEQTVMVFASATARTTALSGVLAEGMVSYLQDTNAVEVYDGSAWVSIGASGDITAVVAGIGLSGGGTSGSVTLTNTVATTFDAAGDLVYGTGADTFTKLAIGTAGQILQVNSGATAPEWATPSSGGGQTLISTTSLTGASITLSSIPTTYKHLYLVLKGVYLATVGSCTMQLNGDTGNNYSYSYVRYRDATVGIGYNQGFSNIGGVFEAQTATTTTKLANAEIVLPRYTDTDTQPVYIRSYGSTATATTWYQTVGSYDNSAAITSIKLTPDFNFSGGTAYLYGVA